MDQVKFVEDNLKDFWRSYGLPKTKHALSNFFKGCLLQILIDPCLNNLSYNESNLTLHVVVSFS